jgi:hypothetical protein
MSFSSCWAKLPGQELGDDAELRIVTASPDQLQANREWHPVNRQGAAERQRRNGIRRQGVAFTVSCKAGHRHYRSRFFIAAIVGAGAN